MNYSERTFEINNQEIKFRNTIFGIILIGSFTSINAIGFLSHSGDILHIIFWFIGSILGIMISLYLFGLLKYIDSKVLLSNIDYIQVEKYLSENGKAIFEGTGKIQNFFPAGFNKNKADKLIFIHQKNKKVVICFAPDNCDETIKALKESGIKVIEKLGMNK
jgi:hypothetical protein